MEFKWVKTNTAVKALVIHPKTVSVGVHLGSPDCSSRSTLSPGVVFWEWSWSTASTFATKFTEFCINRYRQEQKPFSLIHVILYFIKMLHGFKLQCNILLPLPCPHQALHGQAWQAASAAPCPCLRLSSGRLAAQCLPSCGFIQT